MGIVRKFAMAGAVSFAVATASFPAYAVTWDFIGVEQGTDGDFSASSFHDSSGANGPMTAGPQGVLGQIGGSGNFGDYTDDGTFTGTFTFGGLLSFTLFSSNLLFGTDGFLSGPATMTLDITNLSGTNALSDYMGTTTTTIGFMSTTGGVCCDNATYIPNSFTVDGTDAYIALWGANGFNSGGDGSYSGSTLGMDLRIHLKLSENQEFGSEVPIPASLPLFGTGLALMGYLGWRRKRKA